MTMSTAAFVAAGRFGCARKYRRAQALTTGQGEVLFAAMLLACGRFRRKWIRPTLFSRSANNSDRSGDRGR